MSKLSMVAWFRSYGLLSPILDIHVVCRPLVPTYPTRIRIHAIRIAQSGLDQEQLQDCNSSKGRRWICSMPLLCSFLFLNPTPSYAWFPAKVDLTKVPARAFDPNDKRLRDAAAIFEKALLVKTVEEEEKLWTEIIEKYSTLDAEWVPDILSRAYGNRGNARSRQGKLEAALEDYDRSIGLAPYAVDPILNRGVALEKLRRYDEALADYGTVLSAQPNDPAAWNNLGNVKAALGKWNDALESYNQAVQLAPEFSFAAANYALSLYQIGKEGEAIRLFRSILRKYPEFPDVRAALAVSLYARGLTADAENNWTRVEDGRYRDRNWVQNTRIWPPKLIKALENFLDLEIN